MSSNNIPEVPPEIPGGAVSVYGQDGLDDFPVLKAFQQYVDAEQAKARKRMIMLCLFFAALMTFVVGVFVIVIFSLNNRNQALNDRFVEFVLKDRAAAVQPAAGTDAAVKAMTDAMSTMQRQLAEQQARVAEQQMKLAEQAIKNATDVANAAAAKVNAPQPPVEEGAEPPDPKLSAAESRLRRMQERLKAEREAFAKEKELLRQQEVELQRRRMYPEWYDADGNLLPAPRQKASKATTPLSQPAAARPANVSRLPEAPVSRFAGVDADDSGMDDDSDEDIKAIDEALARESIAVDTKPGNPAALPEDGALTYFSDDEDDLPVPAPQSAKPGPAAKPAEATPSAAGESGWRIPLE